MGTRRRHPFPSSLFFNDVSEWWCQKGFQRWRFRPFSLTKAYLPSFNLNRVEVFTPRSELSVMMRNSNDLSFEDNKGLWSRGGQKECWQMKRRNVARELCEMSGVLVNTWALVFQPKTHRTPVFWPNPQHHVGKVTETQNPTFKKNKRNSQNIFCWKITG